MVYIGATWRIRLNRPREAAMRSYVKLLSPLVDASDGMCWHRLVPVVVDLPVSPVVVCLNARLPVM